MDPRNPPNNRMLFMPQIIPHADFSDVLKKPSTNKQQAQKFLAKYPIEYKVAGIKLPEGFTLYSNRKGTSIRLIDRKNYDEPRIAYAVDIEITDQKINHKTCTQILVWASPKNEDLLIGFPRLIFNHLLQTYIIMVTDKQQTPDGKRFWERRILQALNDNKYVYYLDKKSNQGLQPLLTEDDFLENFEPIGWGEDKEYQERLFVILDVQVS